MPDFKTLNIGITVRWKLVQPRLLFVGYMMVYLMLAGQRKFILFMRYWFDIFILSAVLLLKLIYFWISWYILGWVINSISGFIFWFERVELC